jgi:lysophospholipase L1-like esterase
MTQPPPDLGDTWTGRLILLCLGLLTGLLTAEAACIMAYDVLRVYQQRPSWVFGLTYENVPHFESNIRGIRYRFNSWGMVGEDIPTAKPTGERRLVLLGDSIAMGVGVRAEQSSTKLVERALSKIAPSGGRVRILNFGTLSYNLWDYYYCLRGKGWRFQPDGVLLFLCLNDAWPKALGLPLPGPDGRIGLWPRFKHLLIKSRLVYSCLYVFNVNKLLKPFFGKAAGVPAQGLPSDPLSAKLLGTLDPSSREALRATAEQEGWTEQTLRDAVREIIIDNNWPKALPVFAAIAQECQQRGVPFKVVVFPVSFQVQAGYRDERPQKEIMAYLRAQGIESVDLRPPLSEAAKHGRVFLHGDMLHPNEAGHQVVTREIMKMFPRGL